MSRFPGDAIHYLIEEQASLLVEKALINPKIHPRAVPPPSINIKTAWFNTETIGKFGFNTTAHNILIKVTSCREIARTKYK